MRKIPTVLFALTLSAQAFGGWINADDLNTGDNVTDSFSDCTVNWVSKQADSELELQPLHIASSTTDYPGNHSKYFGSNLNDHGTFNLFDLYLQHEYPDFYGTGTFFKALAITFSQPASSFSFKAESFSGDSQLVLFFDKSGKLIDRKTLTFTSDLQHPDGHRVLDYAYTFDLTQLDIGSIIVGSESSATHYYALDVEKGQPTPVPEPSAFWLAIAGWLLLAARSKITS